MRAAIVGRNREETDMAEGFDRERLGRVSALCDRYVNEGKIPGAQVQVAHEGKVALRYTAGKADLASGAALRDDAVFRIFSMTKPITSLALMQLYEQGLVLLEDPVAAYIPEFGGARVWDGGTAAAPRTRPAANTMTVRDVLTHTSGLTYGFFHAHPLDALYRDDGLGDFGVADYTLEEGMQRLAAKPLLFEPGTAWNYSMSTDVCGRIVEVVSGQRLDEYFTQHIFGPLGMADTGFAIAPTALDRATSMYMKGPAGDLALVAAAADMATEVPKFLSGGGGLLSTTDDYQRFCDMLLGGGVLDGRRVIGRKTLQYMASNHLPHGATLNDLGQATFSEAVMEGMGFGLGFSVVQDPAANGAVSSVGEFAWGGAASTAFWIDPVERITAVFMTQFMPSSFYPIRRELKATVYQALH